MVHIEYTGKKPAITSTGVSFTGKQDKYNYIVPSAQILNKLINSKKVQDMTEDDALTVLYTLVPDFDTFYNEKIDSYKQKLDLEKEQVQEDTRLNEIEKKVLHNNYDYMRDYRIQRATNKLVYEETINTAVKLIKEKEIKNIKTPPSRPFLHVLESLKTTMDREKVTQSSQIDIKMEEEDSYAQLSFA